MSNSAIQEVASAVIAILSTIGAFLGWFYELTSGKDQNIPDFVALLIGAVVASYLTRVASVNGARQAGTAAAQTAIAASQPNSNATTTPKVS